MLVRKSLSLVALLAVFTACSETPTNPPLDSDLLTAAADKGNHGKIVFSDGTDIWVMNADGSGQTNLTPGGPGVDDTPSWSRNGRQILFVSDRNNPGRPGGFPPAGQGGPQHEVYIMNADGSDVRQVTSTDQRDQWSHMSPDGMRIVFTRDLDFIHVPQVFVINVDGTGETNLTNNGEPACFPAGQGPCVFENHARWSPNGKQLLYNSATVPGDADIFVMNADGSARTNLTNSPGSNDFFPGWSPNGKAFAFSGGPPGAADIFVQNTDGTGLVQLTTDGGTRLDLAPVWSPNGNQIAFFSVLGGPPTISSIDLDGTNQTALAVGGFFDWAAGTLH